MWRDRVQDARILDLFAGAGVVALEALSRGAREVLCVDRSPVVLAVIASNAVAMEQSGLRTLRLELPEEMRSLPDPIGGPFDLVFADPPYAFDRHRELLEVVRPLLRENSRVAIEHSSRAESPVSTDDLIRVESRAYGESSLSLYAVGGDATSTRD